MTLDFNEQLDMALEEIRPMIFKHREKEFNEIENRIEEAVGNLVARLQISESERFKDYV